MPDSLLDRLKRGDTIAAPGVGDALGARLVEQTGFECVYVSGFQVAATRGWPDVGLVTLPEMLTTLRLVCGAVTIPVVSDADDGYGHPLNVMRTVQEYERAGVTALHIEDQDAHRCGGAEGVKLLPVADMCAKVHAALDSRTRPGTVIIARTDAANTDEGVDGTIRRGMAYRSIGADAVMVHGLTSRDAMQRCRDSLEGPLVLTIGSRVDVPLCDLRSMGYQLVLYPLTTLRAHVQTVRRVLGALHADGGIDHAGADFVPSRELRELLGFPRFRALEQKYTSAKEE